MVTSAPDGGGPGLGAQRLRDDLARLGVRAGAVVLVQASMKEIGWIDGGAATRLRALRDCVGPAGTVTRALPAGPSVAVDEGDVGETIG
jgi:hypothetical protein